MSGCEDQLKEPLKTEGDPQQIRKELEELNVNHNLSTILDLWLLLCLSLLLTPCQALSEEISGHKSDLDSTVEAGRVLGSYTYSDAAAVPDIGLSDLQRRYDAIKVSETRDHTIHVHVHLPNILQTKTFSTQTVG